MCCRGKCLSERQKRFSKLIEDEKQKLNDSEEHEYASALEAFIDKHLAPEILTNQGRMFILVLWFIMICVSLMGAKKITMNFSLEFFLIPGQPVTDFAINNGVYFEDGGDFDISHKLDNVDVASEETQLKILEFYEKLDRSYLMEETWMVKQFNWRLWYKEVNDYVRKGKCMFLPEGLTPFQKTIPPEVFYLCYNQAIAGEDDEKACKNCESYVLMSDEKNPVQRRILAARERIDYKRIGNASTQGVQFLKDIRKLVDEDGYGE